MSEIALALSLLFAGAALGWTANFSFLTAPQAMRDMDFGRATRFVRNSMRNGHGPLAVITWVGAFAGYLAGAIAGGTVLAIAGVLYLLARYALAPREDKLPPPGGKRNLQTARIVAAWMTAMIMILVAVGAVLVALRI
jgi:hypothetical protein